MMQPANKLLNETAGFILESAEAFNWLLRQTDVKAQAYFWNYSGRRERRKAILNDMRKERENDGR